AIATELVGMIDRKLCPTVTNDLTFLTERARDDVHLSPTRGVMGDSCAVSEAFVVRMGMHKQQPRGLLHGRTIPVATWVFALCRAAQHSAWRPNRAPALCHWAAKM